VISNLIVVTMDEIVWPPASVQNAKIGMLFKFTSCIQFLPCLNAMRMLFLNSQIKLLELTPAVLYTCLLCLFSMTNYIQNKDTQDGFK